MQYSDPASLSWCDTHACIASVTPLLVVMADWLMIITGEYGFIITNNI
jgi:hypothetical protein